MSSIRSSYNDRKKKVLRSKRLSFGLVFLALMVAVWVLARDYVYIFRANIKTPDGKNASLYIPSDADFQYVKNELTSMGVLVNAKAFTWLSKRTDYVNGVHPGHYSLTDKMTNQELVDMLRFGHQTPVKVVFHNIRNIEQLAGRISKQIEPDSIEILNAIKDNDSVDATSFIPNTYELYWNTDAESFVERMTTEYNAFWNDTRKQKAQSKKLTQREVSILASIIDKETTKTSEMPRIAGVYLNRLKRHWPLQADPTLIYALGDYTIRRVLDVHKKIDSPYNTYKYAGLPPGPICIPSIASIDAVLNAENHKYYYFCAKEDLSGYHVFARNITEHNRNAEKYRKALNKNKIYK